MMLLFQHRKRGIQERSESEVHIRKDMVLIQLRRLSYTQSRNNRINYVSFSKEDENVMLR